MEEIKSYIKGDSTIVFLGSSGVGKSTFTNYLLGDQIMKTNAIREEDSKGHHTTTYRQMFILENGTKIIDTPGMRELGMMEVHCGMEKTFADIYTLEKECRFSDCTHKSEPGCAIQLGLIEGRLTKERWDNYLKIQKESRHQELKEQRKKAREEKGSGKKQTKYNRNTKHKSKML